MRFAKKYKIIICVLLSVIVVALLGFLIYDYHVYNVEPLSEKSIEKIKESKANKLMIVAHPDDETIWGGIHLIEDDYFVVCITNGNNDTRAAEFEKILEATGSEGIIMSYPDKVYEKRDNWSRVYDDITEDLEKVIEAKDWELIVTHNPSGEYGHEHHKMTDKIVTGICEKEEVTGVLYYFGKYYKKSEIEDVKEDKKAYDKELVEKKEEVLKLYESQSKTVNNLKHMNPYEEWIAYSEWE